VIKYTVRDFSRPPRNRRDPRSSGLLRSE